MAIPHRYILQKLPAADGDIMPGWPIQGQSIDACLQNCEAYNSCDGFSYKGSDMSSPTSICTIYSRVKTWKSDFSCGNDGTSLCRGYKKKYTDYDPDTFADPYFIPQLYPIPERGIPGFPIANLPNIWECGKKCDNMGAQCGGFTYRSKNLNPPFEQSMCWAWPFDAKMREDDACDPYKGLCQSFAKFTIPPPEKPKDPGQPGGTGGNDGGSTGRVRPVNEQLFSRAPQPFGIGGTLQGYPKYGELKTAYDCSRRCSFVKSCAAFTFKDRDPGNPNDKTICWLKPVGTTWGFDAVCRGKNEVNLCQGWIKKPPS